MNSIPNFDRCQRQYDLQEAPVNVMRNIRVALSSDEVKAAIAAAADAPAHALVTMDKNGGATVAWEEEEEE